MPTSPERRTRSYETNVPRAGFTRCHEIPLSEVSAAEHTWLDLNDLQHSTRSICGPMARGGTTGGAADGEKTKRALLHLALPRPCSLTWTFPRSQVKRSRIELQSWGWQDMQELVAGLLRAMGYKTVVSPPGSDRGKTLLPPLMALDFRSRGLWWR